MPKVTIIGAGLAGSLLSIYLARRGMEVEVFEARADMRKAAVAGGRSINLALSDRGIAALREVGMDEYMLAEAVPMFGRMIHPVNDETKLLSYSGRGGEYINSVSRAGLNIALINEATKYERVRFYFEHRCTDLEIENAVAIFANGEQAHGDCLIATDGAGSAVRQTMATKVPGFDSSSTFLEHGYKELHIPPGDSGGFRLEQNALHIWPRHQFMMIALPNFDGSFTCTLFLAQRSGTGESGEAAAFDRLIDEAALLDFFSREFADALPLIPSLVEDFFHNPTGELGTVQCSPWNANGKVLLLGDAAHAMVPFYGQGMNCAFEDVRILDRLLEKNGTDWNRVFDEYCQARRPNADAIQIMAVENFYEMRDATADPVFQRKRQLETRLEQTFPDYFSKYSMVTFREDVPYALAKEKGNAQDRLLMKLCADIENVEALDLELVISQLRSLSK